MSHFGFAAISPQSLGPMAAPSGLEVPFFKSPESLFPSGSVRIEALQKQQLNARLVKEKFYKWQNRLFKTYELRPVRPIHLSRSVIDPRTKRRFKVMETNVGIVRIYDEQLKKPVGYAIDALKSDPYDQGYAITLMDAYLRKSSSDEAKVLTTIPQGYSLVATKYENGFAKVSYKNYSGYIRLSEIITKFDLASIVFAKQKWHFVKKREFDWIVTIEGKKIHLSQIKGLVTPDQKGIIASNNQKIPMWSAVEIVSDQRPTWVESALKGHGTVWWKPATATPEEIFTVDELLKKEISSVSFHPKDPMKGVLSANGVFITDDGYHWKKLSQFASYNGPVHYFNDLLLFVGHFRSTDGGKTFENYIQIEKMASAIEYSLGFFPKKLQVKRIETRPPFRLKIEVDTGNRNIKLESPLFAQEWKVIKG